MAWNSGIFTRTNGTYSGATVWATDKVNAFKIVASRHDTHDQDLADGINACLHKGGQNSPTADINWGGFRITNLGAATSDNDAVRKVQLDAVKGVGWTTENLVDHETRLAAAEAAIVSNDGDIATNTGNIATNTSNISSNSSAIASMKGVGWTTENLKDHEDRITILEGQGVPSPLVTTAFKSNGYIRHKLQDGGTGSETIDIQAYNRWRIVNNGALTLTFTNLPATNDTDLGDFQVEGQIVIENGASPGTVSISGFGTPDVAGAQVSTADVLQVLSYIFQRRAGVNYTYLIWSN